MAEDYGIAGGGMRASEERGRKVPDVVTGLGVDNGTWWPLHDPPLTTVRMFKHETGIQAARRLIDVIERGATPGFELRLGTELIVRESCGCRPTSESTYSDYGS